MVSTTPLSAGTMSSTPSQASAGSTVAPGTESTTLSAVAVSSTPSQAASTVAPGTESTTPSAVAVSSTPNQAASTVAPGTKSTTLSAVAMSSTPNQAASTVAPGTESTTLSAVAMSSTPSQAASTVAPGTESTTPSAVAMSSTPNQAASTVAPGTESTTLSAVAVSSTPSQAASTVAPGTESTLPPGSTTSASPCVQLQLLVLKSVLVQLGNRSRVVNFACTDGLLEKVQETYADQLSTGDKLFLQIQDPSWGVFLDLMDYGSVADRSILRVVVEKQEQVSLHVYTVGCIIGLQVANILCTYIGPFCYGNGRTIRRITYSSILYEPCPNSVYR